MKRSDFSRHALGICAAAVMLAACGGLQGRNDMQISAGAPAISAQDIPRWEASQTAHRACPKSFGQPECLVLVDDAGAGPSVPGWAPADFQARYNLPSSSKGSGQVVAIVDAYDNPNVTSDLAAYRAEFDLGTANLIKYNQQGLQGIYREGSPGWGVEFDVDVEMASATCPLCTIYLVEANSSDNSDLQSAEKEAVKLGAHIVSNSWTCYGSVTCVDKSDFDSPRVTYLAASGNEGYNAIGAPAALASVAAIGGTALSKKGSQYSETVWSDSGGGCATGVPKPRWQHDTVCAYRAVGDAAAVANDVAAYDTFDESGWFTVSGTSVSTPLLAGVFGLAGNATKQYGGRTFWKSANRKGLYDVCSASCLFSTYSYGAGWGSPDGIGAF